MKRSKIYSRLMINRELVVQPSYEMRLICLPFFLEVVESQTSSCALCCESTLNLYIRKISFPNVPKTSPCNDTYYAQKYIIFNRKYNHQHISHPCYRTLSCFSHFLPRSEICIMVKVNRVGEMVLHRSLFRVNSSVECSLQIRQTNNTCYGNLNQNPILTRKI